MAPDHAAFRHALRARGADEILPQDLEHRRAREPRDYARGDHGQRNRGQGEMRQKRAEVAVSIDRSHARHR